MTQAVKLGQLLKIQLIEVALRYFVDIYDLLLFSIARVGMGLMLLSKRAIPVCFVIGSLMSFAPEFA